MTVARAPGHGTGADVRRTSTIDGTVDREADQIGAGGPWATGRDAGTREPLRRRRRQRASIGSRATARVLVLQVPSGRRSGRADRQPRARAGPQERSGDAGDIEHADGRQVAASSLPLRAEKSSIRRRTSMVPANRLGRRLVIDTKTRPDPLVGKAKSTKPSGLGGDALIPRGIRGHTERHLEPNPRVGAQSLRSGPPFSATCQGIRQFGCWAILKSGGPSSDTETGGRSSRVVASRPCSRFWSRLPQPGSLPQSGGC